MKGVNLTSGLLCGIALISTGTTLLLPSLTKGPEYSRHQLSPEIQASIARAKQLLDEGRQARRDGDLVTAEAKFRGCLQEHSSLDSFARKELGQVYEEEGKPEQAFEMYQKTFNPAAHSYSDFPNDVESLAHYGLLAEQHGQYAEAARVYEQAHERLGPSPSGGVPVALNVHFDPQAEPTALQSSQLRAMLNVVRGIALEEQGKSNDSLAAYAAAAKADPKQPVAQMYLGRGLQKVGRSAEAKTAFAKAAQFGQDAVKAAAEKALKR